MESFASERFEPQQARVSVLINYVLLLAVNVARLAVRSGSLWNSHLLCLLRPVSLSNVFWKETTFA